MTMVVTPTAFKDDPLPSVTFYDWTGPQAQAAIMYQTRVKPPVTRLVTVLQKGVGYDVKRNAFGDMQCRPIYPGIVRPDWMKAARCQCRGVIENNAALSPNEVTQILSCPISWQAPRVMWAWYTTKGHPVVFVEAASTGPGLTLADYYQWMPGQKLPAESFGLPKACIGPDNKVRPSAGSGATSFSNPSCSDCHTTPW
jgi:hypothetical protein